MDKDTEQTGVVIPEDLRGPFWGTALMSIMKQLSEMNESLRNVTEPTMVRGKRVWLMKEEEVCERLNREYRWVRKKFPHTGGRYEAKYYNWNEIREILSA